MSTINIDNLPASVELDGTAVAELRGGFAIPAFAQNILMSISETTVALAPVNFTVAADHGSVANIGGGVTLTNVIGSSQLTLLQGL